MHTASDIPNVEPQTITKGSTVKWNKTLSHYSAADGWALTYAFRGVVNLDITTTANGSDHAIVLSSTQTAALKPGDYSWQSYATKGSERFDVGFGRITVKADFAAIGAPGYDGRSHVKKVIDAIEATLEGRATTADKAISIGGKSATYWDPAELIKFHDRYKALYAEELNSEKMRQGLRTSKKVFTRFVNA